jgi:thiamine-monophosphate kinase
LITISEHPRTLAGLGEFGLIAELAACLPPGPRALVGIGDDAAVLAVPDGRVVATTDFLLEGRHFRRDWASGRDVGHKAAARGLADLAAMGAVPSALLVALAVPSDLPVGWATELAAGLAAECARAGAGVIGGDTASAPSVLLAVTGLGDLAGRPPVLRSGAAPGDLVAVAGPLGHAAAGLALLSAGLRDEPQAGALVAAHLRPEPPYDAGPEAAALGATAMIDVSDGLLADLGHIADASGVQIDVDTSRLRPGDPLLAAARAAHPARRHAPLARTNGGSPARPPASAAGASPSGGSPARPPASAAGASPSGGSPARPPASAAEQALQWVLVGGEDHSLAATFPPSAALPARWTVIGQVREGKGILVDGRPWSGARGWDHFA